MGLFERRKLSSSIFSKNNNAQVISANACKVLQCNIFYRVMVTAYLLSNPQTSTTKIIELRLESAFSWIHFRCSSRKFWGVCQSMLYFWLLLKFELEILVLSNSLHWFMCCWIIVFFYHFLFNLISLPLKIPLILIERVQSHIMLFFSKKVQFWNSNCFAIWISLNFFIVNNLLLKNVPNLESRS